MLDADGRKTMIQDMGKRHLFNMETTAVILVGQYECYEIESLVKLHKDLISTKLEKTRLSHH